MLAKQTNILNAAVLVFSRYGYKRATMNDIASEAGVARQTLYNAFSNKETILRAIIRQMTDETIIELEALGNRNGSLSEALDLLFEHIARKPYQALKSSPHADELIEGINGAAAEELSGSCDRKIAATEKLFVKYQLSDSVDVTSIQLAKLAVSTALAFPKIAKSEDELETLLKALKELVQNAFVDEQAQ